MSEGPILKRLLGGRSVKTLALWSGAALGAVVLIMALSFFYASLTERREREQAAVRADQAAPLAERLAARFAELTQEIDRLGRDADLVELFKARDENTLAAKAKELAPRFGSALLLRFILPGAAKLDSDGVPPLGYASLDLLRRAETSTTPLGAEAHFFGNPKQHVVIVRRVDDTQGSLVGLIHLSLDVGVVNSAITGLGLENAYIEVHQGARGGSPVVLAKTSDSGPPIGIRAAELPIPGTRWTMHYWPLAATAGNGAGPAETSVFWAIAGVALLLAVLVAAGIPMLTRRRRPAPAAAREDAVVYQGAVKAIMDGVYPGLDHLIPDLHRAAPPPRVESASLADTIPLDAMPSTDPEGNEPMNIAAENPPSVPAISDSIFRAYDIRGVVDESLTEEAVYHIGLALGSEAQEQHSHREIVVGRDGRKSGPALAEALQRGLRDSGCDVIDIGMVPTPVLYYATHYLDTHSGVMVTGSHNPSNYNGLKIVLDGKALSGEAITAIRDRIKRSEYARGSGERRTAEIGADYMRAITDDIPVALGRAFRVVVDCGNGVAGVLAPKLIRALGHDVIELYCDVDGTFPNHHPDPSQPENLEDLIQTVKREKAELGLAFDGDGDRLGVVDGAGNIIWPDRQMMLFAKDVLSRNPGKQIIFDVKCSRHLRDVIRANGGVPLMWKTGHSLIKAKMRESDAPLAGEMSGHIFFKERWYGFDDALYAAARLLEILVKDERPANEVFAALPGGMATPELRLAMPENQHAQFMIALKEKAAFEGAAIVTVDGLRVDFPDGWGLIRPSNTTPYLILRFEADSRAALDRIQTAFRQLLMSLDPGLELPF